MAKSFNKLQLIIPHISKLTHNLNTLPPHKHLTNQTQIQVITVAPYFKRHTETKQYKEFREEKKKIILLPK